VLRHRLGRSRFQGALNRLGGIGMDGPNESQECYVDWCEMGSRAIGLGKWGQS
jgi:hypothetical protein